MHWISQSITGIGAAFTSLADANPVYMPTDEKRAAILELKRIETRALELRLRIAAEAQDVVDRECARDIAAVLVAAGLDDAKHAHAEVKLMAALTRYEHVRAGMATGEFTAEHATVITRCLDDLPQEVEPWVIAKAETELCDWARQRTPHKVRKAGKRILQVVDPERAEAIEARWLQRLEAAAEDKATLSVKQLGDGTTRIYGIVPDALGIRFTTVLESYAQPRKTALEADGRIKPRGRLMAEALGSLLEHVDPDTLPAHGGDATTVIVTTTLDSLRSELGLATMADGTLITASEARRLACTASIIPCVLGGESEILDLGRSRRLFSPGQRKALGIRDKHCRAEGCTVPATWCDAHHLKPWSQGGKTNLDDGVLLCGHHHRSIHDPKYQFTRLSNGDIRFHRRR